MQLTPGTAEDQNQNQNQNPLVYLHAELLPHIRHITLYVSVPAAENDAAQSQDSSRTPVRETTGDVQLTLSESRRAVSVSVTQPNSTQPQEENTMETMKLPARVTEGARYVLRAPQWQHTPEGRRESSFRMQVDADNGKGLLAGSGEKEEEEEPVGGFVPWRAPDMRPGTRVRCRGCEGVVLDPQQPSRSEGWVWKDLPSGNWAEMMDFWHCHKPDPEVGHGHGDGEGRPDDPNATVKGYGAANQVVATVGTILVDVATFLVAAEDCLGVKKVRISVSLIVDPDSDDIHCCNCNTLLGQVDPVAKGWRLFKTALSATTNTGTEQSEWETHPIEVIIAAQLLELVERESARRFVVHWGHSSGLLIWVFNPDMRYSNSSAHHSIAAQRAMKVFFQRLHNVEQMLHPEVGKPSSTLALEEVQLPEETYRAFEEVLDARNAMLPVSARVFREWRVGILHRLHRR
ncbi:hypothetical protein BO86DRAFT_308210 [Aspergillus japonicus CBS 114.51]|uniref:Ubiquitin-conjugating enzyme E2-binding protein n=1 Tax=Aspergillus japonicus CBS 114.51 TaxID=1448312 RepID=A0A8T8X6Q9_ASPJA|nr:hypothetical protein BO86DRAFT_308210 [Aspergillus japonicus CBS 114.51]RAH83660.1 hypothetical protein BO86DRAFT_308210 [Aspergillus japonicus CBS 114.51]